MCAGSQRGPACLQYDLELTSGALQMDSFCPDSAHPVILQSQASDATHSHGPNNTSFALSLQVQQFLSITTALLTEKCPFIEMFLLRTIIAVKMQ